jgi:TolB-like protein/DNA-binding winged helix-turn-helix (wHTH) protein/Tfp pilus assembly protein PilF
VAEDFRVGEWLVSPTLNQISGTAKSTRVEPKVMQVLLYLAQNPGVASKERLISAVWPGVFVSDDVLPGCISALRKAFNENARNPQIVETIHKGGYRLLLPVEWCNGNHVGGSVAQSTPPVHALSLKSYRPFIIGATALLVIFCSTLLAWINSRSRYDSVAVLPFINLGNDVSAAYLSDGIAEGVINDLSAIPELKTMAWTTVSRYRDPQPDLRKLGRELGVKSVLVGRLLRQGDRLMVQTELVDVASGSQLWGEQYGRNVADSFNLQQQLSRDIVANLRVRFTGAAQKKMLSHYTPPPQAYELYLKGRYFWNQRSKGGLLRAIESFEGAIKIDPKYAVAYAGLADSYNLLDDWGTTLPRESFPKARAAAEKALQLDESLAEAHTSLAMVRESYDWDWAGAEQEYKRAIELDPNYATAHEWYGMHLAAMQRFPEAEAQVKQAQQLDPLSPIITTAVGEVYSFEGRYDDAIVWYRKALELNPAFCGAYGNLADAYESKNMYPEAVKTLVQMLIVSGEVQFAASIQKAYSRSGYRGVLQQELVQDLKEQAGGQYKSPVGIASTYALLGNNDKALKYLAKGYEQHSSSMQYLNVGHGFDQLRPTPQFQYWSGVLGLPSSPGLRQDVRTARARL